MRQLTSVVIAVSVAIVMAGAQSYPDTVDGHVAAAKAAAGSEYARPRHAPVHGAGAARARTARRPRRGRPARPRATRGTRSP